VLCSKANLTRIRMSENTIYFKPTKKVKFARSFNHLVPGMLLLLLGIESLSHGDSEHLVFALLEIGAGAALMISFIRDMRQSMPFQSPR